MKLLKMILSHLKKLDYVLIAAVLFLSAFGLLMVYSAGYPLGYMKYHDGSYFFMKQLQWLLIGLAFFFGCRHFPIQSLQQTHSVFGEAFFFNADSRFAAGNRDGEKQFPKVDSIRFAHDSAV